MRSKIIFFIIMVIMIAIVIFVPWALAVKFGSNMWYLSAIPLLIVTMVVWVKGFDCIPI